jgi:predicted GIY-YIG superfamily endonuclease
MPATKIIDFELAQLGPAGQFEIYVYRETLYKILYVGQTNDPVGRQDGHRRKTWWHRVDPDLTYRARYATREEALLVETSMIQKYRPWYNRKDNIALLQDVKAGVHGRVPDAMRVVRNAIVDGLLPERFTQSQALDLLEDRLGVWRASLALRHLCVEGRLQMIGPDSSAEFKVIADLERPISSSTR